MAFQFPASPTLGQLFTPIPGITYSFDGTGWVLAGAPLSDGSVTSPKIADGAVTPIKLANPPYAKNAILNGSFNIWQRGTSFAAIANVAYFADRWRYVKIGSVVQTITKGSPGLALGGSTRVQTGYAQLLTTTPVGAPATGDLCCFQTLLEGYNWAPFAQRPLVLSFLVNAPRAGIYSVTFTNKGSDRSYLAEYTVNVPGAWEYKTIQIPASPAAGTWDYETGLGVTITFTLMSGSTFFGTVGAWVTPVNSPAVSPNQVNSVNAAGSFYITGVQLEVGSVATALEGVSIQEELARCQRYFYRMGGNAASNVSAHGFIAGISVLDFQFQLPTPMRAAPALPTSGWSFSGASPGANQIGAFDFRLGTFLSSTHASVLPSFSLFDSIVQNGLFRLTGAGGAFGGLNGDALQLYLGTAAWIDFWAEL